MDKLAESTKWAPGHEQIEKIKIKHERLLRKPVTIAKKKALETGRQVGIKIGYQDGEKVRKKKNKLK